MAGELVVADAGPLIGLAVVDQLSLLNKMFSRVVVPPLVWLETTANDSAQGALAIRSAAFITIETPATERLTIVHASLEGGEAEAVALAMDHPAAVLLVDDLDARRVAQHLNLKVTGTVGLLVAARRADLVPALRPLLDGLVAHGLYLGPRLVDRALADVGEK